MSKCRTHREIIDEIRLKCARAYWSEDSLHPNGDIPEIKCLEPHKLATLLESAHKRDIEELKKQSGNAAKLREVAEFVAHIDDNGYTSHDVQCAIDKARAALAAPARICDKVKDHSDAIGKFEKWMDFSPKTADEQDTFFKEHWFEFVMWLIDMNESEVEDGSR